MNDLQCFEVPRVLEYQGKKVLTTAQLAECYGTNRKVLTKNFERNREKYREGVHYIYLEGEEKVEFCDRSQIDAGLRNAGKLYLWSERGVLLHAKSLNTDRAWEVYEKLLDLYFHVRQRHFDRLTLPQGKVLASEVYSFLGLNRDNYWKWVERNITGNRFAVEGLDYRYIGGNDFILAPSLVKCMCMMSKTDEGERCRQEYIRRLNEYETLLSVLGIRRKEHLTMEELERRSEDPLVALDFSRFTIPVAGKENQFLYTNDNK